MLRADLIDDIVDHYIAFKQSLYNKFDDRIYYNCVCLTSQTVFNNYTYMTNIVEQQLMPKLYMTDHLQMIIIMARIVMIAL